MPFNVARFMSAYQRGMQQKQAREQEAEDRKFEIERRKHELRGLQLSEKERARKEALENVTLNTGKAAPEMEVGMAPLQPLPLPGDTAMPSQITPAGSRTIVGQLPEITVPGVMGPDTQVRPESIQELLRRRREEAMFQSQLKRDENRVEVPAIPGLTNEPTEVDQRIAGPLLTQFGSNKRQEDQQAFTAEQNELNRTAQAADRAFRANEAQLNRDQQNVLQLARQAFDQKMAANREKFDREMKSTDQKALSGEAAKVFSIANSLPQDIAALRAAFQKDYSGALRGIVFGTNRELVKTADNIADKVGRLRSGGAINADEERRFMRQIASFPDLIYGDVNSALAALASLEQEAATVISKIQPSGGGNGAPAGDPLGILN